MKKLIALLICISLVFCQTIPAYADGKKRSIKDMIEDSADAIGEAGDSISDKAADAGKTIKDKASEAGKEIGNKASEAGKAISDGAKATGNAISEGADKAGKAAKEGTEMAGKAISSGAKAAGNAISEGAEKAGQAAKEGAEAAGKAAAGGAKKAKEIAEEGVEKAEAAANIVSEKAKKAGNKIVSVFKSIDPKEFRRGYDFLTKVGGAAFASAQNYVSRKEYFESIQGAIDQMRADMIDRVSVNSPIDSAAGYVVEDWHAGTFNVDATVKGSKERANVVGSTALGSVDVETSYGENASLKYYKNGEASAKAQATNYVGAYKKYVNEEIAKGNANYLSEEDFLNQKCSSMDLKGIYQSLYDGQTRIIPSDQMEEAAEYLRKKAAKESIKDSEIRKAVGNTAKETLDNLSDRLKAPDGTQSKPLTKKEAQTIAELCQTGKFEPADFGISVSQLISPQYILKQAMGAGVTSAELRMAFTIGPQIFSIVKEAIENGEISKDSLKKMGMDGILAGSEGFIEGSVSAALITACQAGTFGKAFINASPDVIGAMTVIAIDAARYGYKMSKGEMTSAEYADILTKELFITVASLGTVALVTAFLPAAPVLYLAGSMAGGMVGSMIGESGYNKTKEVVLEVKGEGGFETIMPSIASNSENIGKTVVSKLDMKEKLSDFKDLLISTTKEGKIKVALCN